MEKLTLEQKVILHLAKKGSITNAGDVQRALKEFEYADKMILAEGDPGLKDDIKKGLISGDLEIEGVGETCAHEPLTNDEIQEVFDNDNDNEEVNS